jgi:hypothetical protein
MMLPNAELFIKTQAIICNFILGMKSKFWKIPERKKICPHREDKQSNWHKIFQQQQQELDAPCTVPLKYGGKMINLLEDMEPTNWPKGKQIQGSFRDQVLAKLTSYAYLIPQSILCV